MTAVFRRLIDVGTGLLMFSGSFVAMLMAAAGWLVWTAGIPLIGLFGGFRVSGWWVLLVYLGGLFGSNAIAWLILRRMGGSESGNAVRMVTVSGVLLMLLLLTIYYVPLGLFDT